MGGFYKFGFYRKYNENGAKKKLKGLIKYEREYDINDIVLFNSYCLKSKDEEKKEIGILSNLYSGCKIPYDGYIFHSSEQILFYRKFKKWGKYLDNSKEVIEVVLNCKSGKEVKNNELVRKCSDIIDNKRSKDLGFENSLIESWKNSYFSNRLKYKYCEEFRKVLEKYSDKYIVEDSHWGDYFAGALLDETSGKYRGCNVCGRVIMRVRKEKDIILKE